MQDNEHLTEHKLFIFNPTSEMAIANGEIAWQPNRTLQQFEKDLELLPYIFAESHDSIVVNELPSSNFLDLLKVIKDINPSFIRKSELKNIVNSVDFGNLSLQPWGWSPAAHHILKPLKELTSNAFKNSPNNTWKNTHKKIVSRQFSSEILSTITHKSPAFPFLPQNLQPKTCHTIKDITDQIKNWGQIVLKAPWSSSGRGVQMLRHAKLNESNKQWISGIIKQQGYIMVEPLLDKLQDFSLQFFINSDEIEFLGVGKFSTNSNGQYISNTLNPQTQFIEKILRIEKLVGQTTKALKKLDIQDHYEGFAGIDLMTIQVEDNVLIHPCVEVNWRYNMGLVALQLQKLIHPEAKGKFCVHFNPKKTFSIFSKEALSQYPVKLKNGLPRKGFYPLSDSEKAISGAYIILE